ncbi:MAG: hypothetical protein PHP35_00580 [Candidatus Colwellbacteria bacterium]|nr:hypothetical protein [Candidatus Colwellbacteria bacterium]
MAIIIQEERNKSGMIAIIIALVILAVGGGLTYYLFFSPVPLAERIVGSQQFQAVSQLSNIRIDAESVTGSSVWSSLSAPEGLSELDTSLPSRRGNPFESF